jgi:hypothetical protein
VDKADTFKGSHFKFLGRWIHPSITETTVKDRVRSIFEAEMTLVDNTKINGFMKLWLYQHHVLQHMTWPFMIHDFNRDFVVQLEVSSRVQLKKWAGLFRNSDVGALFRLRENLGLGLTSTTSHFERMQVVKCCLLKVSVDAMVTAVYQFRVEREAKEKGRVWRPTPLTESASAEVTHALRFPSQSGRQGLGNANYNPNPSAADRRSLIVKAAVNRTEEKYLAHAQDLALQGVWVGWSAKTLPFDFSWRNLIHGPGPHVLSFVLNATINCVRTPDMLKLWGYTATAFCPLCGAEQCTLHHILSNCQKALVDKRYTWRHDSILANIEPVLKEHILALNTSPVTASVVPVLMKSFVRSGAQECPSGRPRGRKHSLLDGANDWELLVDFENHNIVFPPEIYPTPERPDIIIWSNSIRTVVLIELTCPAEEGIEAASLRKVARYTGLIANIGQSGWKGHLLTIEVGARGYVAQSTRHCFRKLGLTGREVSTLCRTLSTVVARCSYAIYLSRSNKLWLTHRALVTLNHPCGDTE